MNKLVALNDEKRLTQPLEDFASVQGQHLSGNCFYFNFGIGWLALTNKELIGKILQLFRFLVRLLFLLVLAKWNLLSPELLKWIAGLW